MAETGSTYIRIAAGFCNLAAILDACSRKVVGYAISRQIDTQLTLAALRSAVAIRRPPPRSCIQCTRQKAAITADPIVGTSRSAPSN